MIDSCIDIIRRLVPEKTWLKITLLAVGSVTLIALGIGGVFAWLFIPWVPAAGFPAPSSVTEAYQQDLSYLQAYAQYEKAFDDESKRSAFNSNIAQIRGDLATMTPARFELAVAAAVALADNGHTNVSPIGRSRRVNRFPIRTGPFEDGEFVLQSTSAHADLLGAALVAVESHPIATVIDAFLPYFGGVERRARFFSHLFLTSPALLHAAGLTNSADGAQLTFRLSSGELVQRYLAGSKPDDGSRQPFGREVMDYRVPTRDEGAWVHLMHGQQPPLYLAEPDEPYLFELLEAQNGAYVKLNFNTDVGDHSLTAWLDSVLSELTIHRPAFAVVDLRFNGGGTDATADFARQLPSLIENGGPLYILTSRETFSAAIGAAAQFKKFAGHRARVVGGLVGDRLRFVANGGSPYTLPNSGITINVWSTWEDYADGCWDWVECFWLSPFFREPGVGNLDPDIAVAMNFRDYVDNRDAALEAVLANATGDPR